MRRYRSCQIDILSRQQHQLAFRSVFFFAFPSVNFFETLRTCPYDKQKNIPKFQEILYEGTSVIVIREYLRTCLDNPASKFNILLLFQP